MTFSGLGLSEWLVKQVETMGLKIPTPVQVNCIPPILNGNVIIIVTSLKSFPYYYAYAYI